MPVRDPRKRRGGAIRRTPNLRAELRYTCARLRCCAEEAAVSEKDPYRVFVTHLFQADEDYQRVFEYLESRDNFFYANSANVAAVPTAGGPEAIKDVLREQIRPAEVVVMPIAMFESNPDLVRFQMDVAQAFKKPILGIKSFGETVAIRKDVVDRCDDIIEWNDRSLINAIKKLARGEDAAEWEVIEFDMD